MTSSISAVSREGRILENAGLTATDGANRLGFDDLPAMRSLNNAVDRVAYQFEQMLIGGRLLEQFGMIFNGFPLHKTVIHIRFLD
jgi:hypothetical protein